MGMQTKNTFYFLLCIALLNFFIVFGLFLMLSMGVGMGEGNPPQVSQDMAGFVSILSDSIKIFFLMPLGFMGMAFFLFPGITLIPLIAIMMLILVLIDHLLSQTKISEERRAWIFLCAIIICSSFFAFFSANLMVGLFIR